MSQHGSRGKHPQTGGVSSPPDSSAGWPTIGVFGKHWTPGLTKTRLAADVGAERAAALSRCFLETTLGRLASLDVCAERVLAYAPRERGDAFAALPAVASGAWRAVPQGEGDLGARMRRFFDDALARSPAAALVGSDSPHLPLAAVQDALGWLSEPSDSPRVCLGPAIDGGYWLVAASRAVPPVFDGMPWSDPALFEATVARLRTAGWVEGVDFRIASRWYDIDESADLRRMRADLPPGDPLLQRLAERLDAILGA